MALEKKAPRGKKPIGHNESGFDVVCVVGRVEFGNGNIAPEVAAFQLIGAHGAPGGYSFPTASGGMCHVEVMFTDEDGAPQFDGEEPLHRR